MGECGEKVLDWGSYDLGLRPNSTQKQQMKDRRQVILFSSSTLSWKIKEDNIYPHKVERTK